MTINSAFGALEVQIIDLSGRFGILIRQKEVKVSLSTKKACAEVQRLGEKYAYVCKDISMNLLGFNIKSCKFKKKKKKEEKRKTRVQEKKRVKYLTKIVFQ